MKPLRRRAGMLLSLFLLQIHFIKQVVQAVNTLLHNVQLLQQPAACALLWPSPSAVLLSSIVALLYTNNKYFDFISSHALQA